MKKNNYIIRAAFSLTFLFTSLEGYSQLIRNPSFEGRPGSENMAPSPWTPCNQFSSPDTQPGVWNVSTPPSHGNSYLGLVTRGNLGPYANHTEAAQIQLTSKLVAGSEYGFGIDLSFSASLGHDVDWEFLSYGNPAVLKIWGGVTGCAKTELLWESPAINHTNWQTYNFTITPQLQQISFLILEASHASLPTYFGNILIDNITEKTAPNPEPVTCIVEAFDIFTPNGDGHNDLFRFKPVSNIVKFNLKVFSRWGNLIFETNDLAKGWDGTHKGKECATGVYFWSIEYMCLDSNQISENSKKGFVTIVK